MSSHSNSPDNILFQSFRHSQGILRPQLYLLEYVERTAGMQISLSPTPKLMGQLARYASQGAARHHIAYSSEAAIKRCEQTFADLRAEKVNLLADGIATMDNTKLAWYFVHNIVSQELKYLDPKAQWHDEPDAESFGRRGRLASRVQSGKASFLFYYGRDGHTTGVSAIDDFYQLAWQTVPDYAAEHPDYAERISQHAVFVEGAALQFLGQTGLSTESLVAS